MYYETKEIKRRNHDEASGPLMPLYRYTRDEAIVHLYQYCNRHGYIDMGTVVAVLKEAALTDRDIAWALRVSRKQGFVDCTMPTDPRMEQLLAMDT